MKKIKITTPENIEVEYTLADIGSRTAAAVIDMLIQGIFMLILFIMIFIIAFLAPDFWGNYYGWIIGITLIIFSLINYGYFIISELNMNGMTYGKKKLNIRAIRNNGQPITLSHSALRNFFRVFIDNFGIGIVMVFFSKERKRLGDMVASTIVVAEENKTTPITLESLENTKEHLSYYLSEEEYELVREYFERRSSIEDNSMLREELKIYFTRKFHAMGNLNEWQSFIDSL
jgi:uncharacterized RDD family membrane protein YckC